MKNNFIENLKKIDPENFEYRVDRDFETKTGIKGKRLQAIIRSEGKVANVDEVGKLLEYYSEKKGKRVEFRDLFGNNDTENE